MAQAKLLREAEAQAPALFTIAPRIDLRTGAVAAGVLDVDSPLPFDAWLALAGDARLAWTAAGHAAPLSSAAPLEALDGAEGASMLDAALRAQGFPMRGMTLEIDEEAALQNEAMTAIERLRGRGWGVLLRSSPDCPLPLGGRVRSLFTDVSAPAPDDLTPFLGLEGYDDAPMARRVRAAANAGLTVTADRLHTRAFSNLLIAAGFDRGQGPGFVMKAVV